MPPITYEKRTKFQQFTRLPPEIRRLIWYWCLPRRIVECDILDSRMRWEHASRRDLDDHGNICECKKGFKVKNSRRPPLIRRVCREAYDVASCHGGWATTAGPLATWCQPGLDSMFFFHGEILRTLWYGAYDRQHRDDTSRVDKLVDAFAHARRVSLPLALYHFDLYPFEAVDSWWLDDWDTDVFEPQMAFLSKLAHLGRNTTVPCAIMTVVLHVPKTQAAQSGLFGRLGEETCKLVSVYDAPEIEKYYEFWLANSPYQPKVGQATRAIWSGLLDKNWLQLSVGFWMNRLRRVMLAAVWLTEASQPPNTRHPNFEGAFRRYGDTFPTPCEAPAVFQAHPWVVKTQSWLPVFEPSICFRLCHDPYCLRDAALSPKTQHKRMQLSMKRMPLHPLRQRQRRRLQCTPWRWRAQLKRRVHKLRGRSTSNGILKRKQAMEAASLKPWIPPSPSSPASNEV